MQEERDLKGEDNSMHLRCSSTSDMVNQFVVCAQHEGCEQGLLSCAPPPLHTLYCVCMEVQTSTCGSTSQRQQAAG